jgi:hypothetical protein
MAKLTAKSLRLADDETLCDAIEVLYANKDLPPSDPAAWHVTDATVTCVKCLAADLENDAVNAAYERIRRGRNGAY